MCGETFRQYLPYKKGIKDVSCFSLELKMVGSDVVNFGCPHCGAHDRTRHIFLFSDKLNIWDQFRNATILHCSPEKQLVRKIKEIEYKEYIIGDLDVSRYAFIIDLEVIDLTHINFPDNYFDIIIANHVLEHIPDYERAIIEIYRVLKSGGFAILQTPYSSLLKHTFQDDNINTDELRLTFYGEKDHYRIFGEDFFDVFRKIGFTVDRKYHNDLITQAETKKYGVNPKEDLFLFKK